MGAAQIKEELYQFIESGDPKLIKMLYAVAKEYSNEKVEKPIIQVEMESRAKESMEAIKKGETLTIEGFKKENRQWAKSYTK